MDYKILSIIGIIIICTILASIIMYVIFDNSSPNRRIGNEITIMVEIIVGISIAIIIQYNQHMNQKKIDDEKELHRKSIFSILYGTALLIPLSTMTILKDWKNIQKMHPDSRDKKIWDAVLETNSEYFRFEKLLQSNSNLLDPTTYTIFQTTERIYNDCFLILKYGPNDKEYVEKLIECCHSCITVIPHKYHDDKIKQKIIELLKNVNV